MAHPVNLPRQLRKWLTCRGSLTGQLKAHCAHFRVHPVATGFAFSHADEHASLHLRTGMLAYVREVVLMCDQRPVVFAHSVLPCAGLRGGWNGITRLGTRPLGEALFNNPRIQREALAYRQIDARHPLFRAARLNHPLSTQVLWARRSVFRLNGHLLLVTEVFLPEIENQ